MPHGPLFTTVFYTPRFSYDGVKVAVPTDTYTAPTDVPAVRCSGVAGPGCRLGGYTGWVIPGSHRHHALLARRTYPAKRAPEAPARGLEWVGYVRVRPSHADHHSLRSGPLRCQHASPRANSRLWANRARFSDISWKLSQNRGVSPKSVQKACHSPYFQNRLKKSALGFLRFPFCPAFSHKELLGLF